MAMGFGIYDLGMMIYELGFGFGFGFVSAAAME